MSQAAVPGLIVDFLNTYDAKAKDEIWQKQSATFHEFWTKRIMESGGDALSDEECDAIIRILDRSGKGNTKETEAVAFRVSHIGSCLPRHSSGHSHQVEMNATLNPYERCHVSGSLPLLQAHCFPFQTRRAPRIGSHKV